MDINSWATRLAVINEVAEKGGVVAAIADTDEGDESTQAVLAIKAMAKFVRDHGIYPEDGDAIYISKSHITRPPAIRWEV